MTSFAFTAHRPLRVLVFALAACSFACLLGHFYGWWQMRIFACLVLPIATVALVALAILSPRGHPCRRWIIQGALGGVVAAVAYDLYRVPFVLGGAPLFRAFTRFGELLLGSEQPTWAVQVLGWSYHFSNGAALGIMFLAMAEGASAKTLFWGAIAWAMFVEVMLLITPYPAFLGVHVGATFLLLTASAHLIFGVTLGAWCRRRTVTSAA